MIALALLASAPLGAACAAEADAVTALLGNWSGSGRVIYTDASSENIRCTAYYTGGGHELRMAIQCQSDKNPINIRSRLKIEGSRATGEWEERTFNASGTASGSVSGNKISLNIEGGGFTGSMAVSFTKSSHSLTISTQGVPMKAVTVNFNRR